MQIFHIATLADWSAALESGEYRTSTLGRSLDEEGFIHASRPEQVAPTYQRFYNRYDGPLTLLTIETDLLTSPWREDEVGNETFPHIYGPLNLVAVTDTGPVSPPAPQDAPGH